MNLHIRDLPDGVHRRLARRAKAEGMSLRAYVVRVLTESTELPSVDEWLDGLAKGPRRKLGMSGAEAVRQSRAEDDARVARGFSRR